MIPETHHAAGAPKRIRILIADDSETFRIACRMLLARMRHLDVVAAANDGEQALRLVARTRPDLVLMDLRMPGLNGLEATRQIRATFPVTRVLLITLHASEGLKAASHAAGADGFIAKRDLRAALPGLLAHLFPGYARRAEACSP